MLLLYRLDVNARIRIIPAGRMMFATLVMCVLGASARIRIIHAGREIFVSLLMYTLDVVLYIIQE